MDNYVNDNFQGQKDCKEGIPAKPNQSQDYYDGYSTEYQREQVMNELTKNQRG